mmetsp:Transcript_29345/g.56319  ORF Transcript_29345/g.56319 Transcript_29345/m.56319 type:complete len:281 (-) Transcript_29345:324-1166(-)
MGRNYRKRRAEEDVDTDDNDHAPSSSQLSLSERLEDTKNLQRQRKKDKGVSTDKLSGYSSAGVQLIQVYENEEEEEAEAAALGDTFANETLVAEEDPNMVKYIEEELRKRRGLASDQQDGRETTEVERLEAELYAIPENLKMGKANEEDASDRWMTGIVEVELPVAHRLDNIEATELAKASMLNTKMFKRQELREKTQTLPASLSSNFSLHRSNFAKRDGKGGAPGRTTTEQESYGNGRPQGGGGRGGDGFHRGGRGPMATDDIVASRFKARERQRTFRR